MFSHGSGKQSKYIVVHAILYLKIQNVFSEHPVTFQNVPPNVLQLDLKYPKKKSSEMSSSGVWEQQVLKNVPPEQPPN